MDKSAILARVDHTLLSQTATRDELYALCDDARRFSCASVCVPPALVSAAYRYMKKRFPVCTVIGFPNGYNTTAAKVAEARLAIEDGATELDMVVNLGMVKEGDFAAVTAEIAALKAVCGDLTLKVIVETCLLTEAEKIALCKCVSDAGADFIKTSTGFSKGGATVEDIRLFKAHVAPTVKIKAAGGIRTFEAAEALIAAGADRIGASALVKLAKEEET
ncbi:MAG: deoxyribose-phosphate aldolase [Clostridia bacterium]|nr:deoxyribose-phosphate aldolase [Clostridia bacterium]